MSGSTPGERLSDGRRSPSDSPNCLRRSTSRSRPLAAELLGTTPEDGVGLDYLSIVECRQAVELTLRLFATGALDGIEARRRLRRVDGSWVAVTVRGHAVRRVSGRGPVLVLAAYTPAGQERPAVTAELQAEVPSRMLALVPDVAHPAVGILDHRWRVAQLSTDVDVLLGHQPAALIGASILEMTHPADAGDLLLAFARATSEVNATVRVRFRDRYHRWRPATAVVTVLKGRAAGRLGFVLAANDEPDSSGERQRAVALEHHLQRIAAEVQAAGVLRVRGLYADASRVPALSDLSGRQWEVVSRLAQGERVPAIASELYLSQSTVRNHLSAIFRKLGVHSQRELLALLRRD